MLDVLDLEDRESDLACWQELVRKLRNPGPKVSVGLVGKYVQLNDAYLSVVEALCHACLEHDAELALQWVCAQAIEEDGAEAHLAGLDAVVVPGGFGNRGVDGMVAAIRWAREQRVPFLGPLSGYAVRCDRVGTQRGGPWEGATSAEARPGSQAPG